jgi:hypothetical protein
MSIPHEACGIPFCLYFLQNEIIMAASLEEVNKLLGDFEKIKNQSKSSKI